MPETERLLLRGWREDDLAPFAALNADPVVMEHFVRTATRAESDAAAARIRADLDERGFGLWALEVKATGAFIGFTGLSVVPFAEHFTPAVEVGWRLARDSLGQGYATEAARASLVVGFDELRLGEIVSFTATANLRSQWVMQRLGMTRDPADDFDNPRVPEGHPIRRHVLYRLSRAEHDDQVRHAATS